MALQRLGEIYPIFVIECHNILRSSNSFTLYLRNVVSTHLKAMLSGHQEERAYPLGQRRPYARNFRRWSIILSIPYLNSACEERCVPSIAIMHTERHILYCSWWAITCYILTSFESKSMKLDWMKSTFDYRRNIELLILLVSWRNPDGALCRLDWGFAGLTPVAAVAHATSVNCGYSKMVRAPRCCTTKANSLLHSDKRDRDLSTMVWLHMQSKPPGYSWCPRFPCPQNLWSLTDIPDASILFTSIP